MTPEEKAKRYDELLLKLQKAKVDDNVCDEMYYRVIDDIVPELKESEDEKIRNVLVDYFKRYKEQEECGIKTFYGIPADDILAWLEKQGIRPRYNIGDVICDKSCTTLNKEAQPNMEIVDIKNGMYICDKGSFPVSQQDEYELVGKKIDSKLNDDSVSNELRAASTKHAEKEILNPTCPDNEEFELVYTFEEGAKWNAAQKSTWSEEDENIKEWIMSDINKLLALNKKSFVIADKEIAWLNSLKYSVKIQQEWTMQDEEELQIALDTLIKAGQHSSAKWLKSVCLVPQSKWKPSEEQMDALDGICSYIRNKADWEISQDMVSDLYKLSEQLKKLRGEKQ